MAESKPKAHISRDGEGGIVTGTHDIALAVMTMRSKLVEYGLKEEGEEGPAWLASAPVLQIGRIIPADTNSRQKGYEWWWRPESEDRLGIKGTTRAVVWLI